MLFSFIYAVISGISKVNKKTQEHWYKLDQAPNTEENRQIQQAATKRTDGKQSRLGNLPPPPHTPPPSLPPPPPHTQRREPHLNITEYINQLTLLPTDKH